MSEDLPNAGAARSPERAPVRPEATPPPYLRMRPRHFFSNDFKLDLDDSAADPAAPRRSGLFHRIVDLHLILMIGFIGVPLLVYCIFATAL